MFRVLICAVTVGTLAWSLENLIAGAWGFIVFCFLLESWLYALDWTQRPRRLEPNSAPHFLNADEVLVAKQFPLLFRYPLTAKSLFAGLSAVQLSAFVWVPWLIYRGHWPLAVPIGLNFLMAGSIAYKLEPRAYLSKRLSSPNEALAQQSGAYLKAIEGVFEKLWRN